MNDFSALSTSASYSLRIIKIGGAAITVKQNLETLAPDPLRHFVNNVLKDPLFHGRTILIHGAGSFGHFQAKEFKIADGNKNSLGSFNTLGFSKTQASVRKLHNIVTQVCLEEGLPVSPVSPFPSWKTMNGNEVAKSNILEIKELLKLGFIPILHGDAVLDETQGCSIISGDLIASHLCRELRPDFMTFLTDVDGIFDRPPHIEGARLIDDITVNKHGNCTSIIDSSHRMEHDVTGGMKAKLDSALEIVSYGVECFIALAGSGDSILASRGIKPVKGTRLHQSDL